MIAVAQPPRLIATGRYDRSVVVKTAQGWRFKARKLHVDAGYFLLMEELKKQQEQGQGQGR